MKYVGFLLGLAIFLNMDAMAHKQSTHQYVVREAWTMLQSQGFTLPAISDHLGYNQGSWNGNLTEPYIVAGAYNEDEADHVYHHGEPNNPFDAWSHAFTSVTHFWRIFDNQLHMFDGVGSDIVEVGTVENAYMKICKFRDGGWSFWIRWQPNLWEQYRYYSLVDLYVNRRVYWIQEADELGDSYPHNCDLILSREQADALTFNILGRMAHLLGDMAVPAHVHSDAHDPIISGNDMYEEAANWEVNQTFVEYWNAGNVLSSKGGFINPYGHDLPPVGIPVS